jgi:serine/threonine protein kinase
VATRVDNGDMLTKTEGNFYFYPPEWCQGKSEAFEGRPVDIWATGVTIYVALFKRLPFIPSGPTNYLELFDMIGKAEYGLFLI